MPAAKLYTPTNLLLASLSRKEYENILSLSKLVELNSGEILSEAGKKITGVYFPVDCYISLLRKIDDTSDMEIGSVGPEGMLGINLALQVKVTLLHAVVGTAGSALFLSTKLFLGIYEKSTVLQQKLQNYAYIRMCQLSQTSGCNRFHVLDGRLCRWILTAQDCTHSNELNITHESLSGKLGVRRAGVTKAAGILQKKKLISYSKGHLKILDRRGLETIACECYRLNKEIYKKIMK
jgi:CRP-like cAMP-binding protein